MLHKKLTALFEDETVDQGQVDPQSTTSEGEFKTIGDDEANKLILSEASEYKEFQKLYCSLEGKDFEYAIHNPLLGKDEIYPYYILIVNYMKAWEQYPNIKNRLLFKTNSTDKNGESYNVIPFNKSIVCIGPKDNIEDCFSNVTINLGMKFEFFDDALNTVLNIANNKEKTVENDSFKIINTDIQKYNKDYTSFFTALATFDALIKNDPQTIDGIVNNMFNKENEDGVLSILEYLSAKSLTLTDMLEKLFAPEPNNFKQMPFNKLILGEIKGKVMWVSNKSLVVKESSYEHIDFYKKQEQDTQVTPEVTNDEQTPSEDPEVTNDSSIDNDEEELGSLDL